MWLILSCFVVNCHWTMRLNRVSPNESVSYTTKTRLFLLFILISCTVCLGLSKAGDLHIHSGKSLWHEVRRFGILIFYLLNFEKKTFLVSISVAFNWSQHSWLYTRWLKYDTHYFLCTFFFVVVILSVSVLTVQLITQRLVWKWHIVCWMGHYTRSLTGDSSMPHLAQHTDWQRKTRQRR